MAIYIPDTSDEAIMECARTFEAHFTAEQFCQRLYKANFGYGPFVVGRLRAMVNKGALIKVGKRKQKTLYAVPAPEPAAERGYCPNCDENLDFDEFCMHCGWPEFHEDEPGDAQ